MDARLDRGPQQTAGLVDVARRQSGRIGGLDRSQGCRPAPGPCGGRVRGGPALARRSQAKCRRGAAKRDWAEQSPQNDFRKEGRAMIAPVLPMLAAQAEPFNSAEYFFEVKWDGVRALAAVEEGGWRLWGRGLADYRPRYPELAVLTALPSGTLVDGELVVFQDGLPRLGDVLQRHQLVDSLKIRQASRQRPVNYVLFDLLAVRGRCLLR